MKYNKFLQKFQKNSHPMVKMIFFIGNVCISKKRLIIQTISIRY